MGGSLTVTKHDPFINQTHEGDMQFLHAMDTSGGDLQANVDKMKRYAQFASDVYQNRRKDGKNFQDQNMLDYVLSQDRWTDGPQISVVDELPHRAGADGYAVLRGPRPSTGVTLWDQDGA